MDFQKGAKNSLSIADIPSTIIEWLTRLQHHGAPTRLLDITKSPYVATYFALENMPEDDTYATIWGGNYW